MERRKRARTSAFLPPAGESLNDLGQSVDSAPASSSAVSVLDRFGGIDGLMSMMVQFQRYYGIFQQIRPVFKMFGSFLGPKVAVKSIPSNKIRMKQPPRSRVASAAQRKTTRKRNVHR